MTFQNKDNLPTLFSADPAAIAAAESVKARIQSAYIMAMQMPRSEDDSRDRILRACQRPAFAERVEYAKPVGKQKIKGPSIRFAELAIREWGNIQTETLVVYEDEYIRRTKVTVLDLQTNATYSREIQVAKTVERRNAADREVLAERTNSTGQTVYIVRATDDELYNKEAALISKAIRNDGLRLLPSDIVDEAIDTARDTLRNRDAKDPAAAKKQVMDNFSAIGVKPKDLQQYLGHSLDILSPAELQDLRSVYRAIRDGEASWSQYVHRGDDAELVVAAAPEATPDHEPLYGQIFDLLSADKTTSLRVREFVKQTAKIHSRTEYDVLAVALSNDKETEGFLKAFTAWAEKEYPPEPEKKTKGKKAEPEQAKGDPEPTLDETVKEMFPSFATRCTNVSMEFYPGVIEDMKARKVKAVEEIKNYIEDADAEWPEFVRRIKG